MLTDANNLTRDAIAGTRDIGETHVLLEELALLIVDKNISEDDMRRECAAEVDQLDDLETIIGGALGD